MKKVGIAALAAVVLAFLAAGAAAALTTRDARNPVAVADRLQLPVAYNGQDGWSQGTAPAAHPLRGGPGHVRADPALVVLDGPLGVRPGHAVGG